MSASKSVRVRDMTAGDPVKLILTFAIPLFIGNIFQQFYSMVDTMVVGYHLGDQAIAAVGATSSLYSLVFFVVSGMNNGYGIVVTQQFGAHNIKRMKQAIAGMMILNLSITLGMSILSVALLPWLMRFLNTPVSVFDQAYTYISIIFSGLICTIGYNMFASILRAVGNSRTPLSFLILSSLLNVVLDLAFVMIFSMGIAGVAIATAIAQLVSAIGCGLYTLRNYREYLPEREDFPVPGALLKELLTMGLSMALMSCLVDIGSIIFQRATNLFGETIIAAYAASRKLLMLMIQPQATIAVANSTFVAQNWGGRQFDRIRSTIKKVLLLEILWSIVAASIIFLFGEPLVRFTTGTSDPEVIAYAQLSLKLHFSMFPFLGVLFCMRNALQSMGQKWAPLISSSIELSMKILSAAFFIPTFGFVGTCITEPISWVLMSGFLVIFYLRKRKDLFST